MSANQTLALVTNTPKHLTTLEYPVYLPEFQVPQADTVLLKANNSQGRYEPRRLVQDERVTENAFRDGDQETTFFGYHPAKGKAARPPPPVTDAAKLVMHMQGDSSEEGKTRIAIHRRTQCTGRDDAYTYDTILDQLLEATNGNQLWMSNLRDLLYRQSDRAVLRVARNLKSMPWLQDEPAWKAPRYPPFAHYIDRMEVAGEDLVPKDGSRNCLICLNAMFPNQDAVALQCKDARRMHVFHKNCLVETCQHTNEHLLCPICRCPLFSDGVTERLVHGMINNSLDYEYDPRFNEWENFERSCWDLDVQRPDDDGWIIIVEKNILLRAFSHMLAGALTEPAESTPTHLQPARTSEIFLLRQAVEQCATRLHGQKLQTALLHDQLMNEFIGICVNSLLTGAIRMQVPPAIMAQLRADPAALPEAFQRKLMPLGFREFAERILNRTVMFLPVRSCFCDDSRPGEIHVHRDARRYWSPEEAHIEY